MTFELRCAAGSEWGRCRLTGMTVAAVTAATAPSVAPTLRRRRRPVIRSIRLTTLETSPSTDRLDQRRLQQVFGRLVLAGQQIGSAI
jgi:hypothetical protein